MTETARLAEAMQSARYASTFTHSFYRYPAAASPEVVRSIIETYSAPGDTVIDPFLGGGTGAVEALALGRRFFGSDLNSLGVFAARAKTTPLGEAGWDRLQAWASTPQLLSGAVGDEDSDPHAAALPDGLRRAIASGLFQHRGLRNVDERLAARCALLRIGQWALESRDEIPEPEDLQERLLAQVCAMRTKSGDLVAAAHTNGITRSSFTAHRRFVRRRAQDLVASDLSRLPEATPAKLLVTSPPYPRVHVLYGKWQIRGRRETSAPYWIIGGPDGLPPKAYTMGSRTPHGENQYFEQLEAAFRAVRPLLAADCLVAQLVAFSDPESQLPRFNAAMRNAGYSTESNDGEKAPALSRQVPNRRWYARDTESSGSKELLLFARPQRS